MDKETVKTVAAATALVVITACSVHGWYQGYQIMKKDKAREEAQKTA